MKKWLLVIGVTVFLAGIYYYRQTLLLRYHHRLLRQRGLSAQAHYSGDLCDGMDCRGQYDFIANGKRYEGTFNMWNLTTATEVGDEIDVLYLPQNPGVNGIRSEVFGK